MTRKLHAPKVSEENVVDVPSSEDLTVSSPDVEEPETPEVPAEPEVENSDKTSSTFHRSRDIGVTIYAIVRPNSDFLSFSVNYLPQLESIGVEQIEITARFSIPSYDELETYRMNASMYNTDARALIIQRPILRRLLMENHLKSVNIPGVELKFNKRGQLTPESLEALDDLHPSIIDLLISKYADKAALML